jgi:hypothetical protein
VRLLGGKIWCCSLSRMGEAAPWRVRHAGDKAWRVPFTARTRIEKQTNILHIS